MYILLACFLTSSIYAHSAADLKLVDGAVTPSVKGTVSLQKYDAPELSLMPPKRIDGILPAEKVTSQPLFARTIIVNKSISKIPTLKKNLQKIGWEYDKNTLNGEVENFIIHKNAESETQQNTKLVVELNWISQKKAILVFKNQKGEAVALQEHSDLVKVFRKKPVKKKK